MQSMHQLQSGTLTSVSTMGKSVQAPGNFSSICWLPRIICVGGDGLFNQVINSLLVQTQLEAGVDIRRPRFIPARPRVKLGIIPAG